MMRHSILLILVLALFTPVANAALAAVNNEPVARVAALRDQALATGADGKQRALKVRASIYEGDTIVTGKRGRLQLLFSDNTIISLGRATTFVINDYLWQPDKQDGAFHSEVKEGIFRVMGGKLTKVAPQNFTTKTPAATIGIRGSMYSGVVSGQRLSVVFQGGRGIVVTNEFGSVEIPKPGYGTHVRADEPPPPPTPFSGDDMDTFTTGFTGTEDDDGSADDGGTADDGEPPPADEPDEPTVFDDPPGPPPNDFDPPLETIGFWTPPADGITLFQGAIGGIALRYDDGSQEIISEPADIFANWYNHKVLGIVNDPTKDSGMPVFFFGDIDGSTVTNVKVFGNTVPDFDPLNPSPEPISVVEGIGSGGFVGTDTGTFYFQGSGYDYAVEPASQPALSEWQVQGVGVEATSGPALRGTEGWTGYVVGISEDMANIDNTRRLLTGSMDLNINKDTGDISGSIASADGSFTLNTSVGGTYGSAFIHDDLFAAILGGGTPALKPHGNFLVTARKDKQFMNYATWGYWEVAYTDATNLNQYHNHVPGAMWVAGNPTSGTAITALAGVTGTYSGQVMASRINTTSAPQVSEVGGTININVNFSSLGTTDAITGNMALDNNAFTFTSNGTAGSPNFSSTNLNGSGFTGGTLNGTMYGPNAESVGGNFKASKSITGGTLTYQGIYGGNR